MTSVGGAIEAIRHAYGLDASAVAAAAKLDTESLRRYEAGEQEIPGEVVWRLSDVLGVPFEDLTDRDSLRRHIDSISVRFKADTGAVSTRVRLAVARAASAARCLLELEEISENPPRLKRLVDSFSDPAPARVDGVAWKAGRDLAALVRRRLGLKGPIGSMLNIVEQLGILVLWQNLTDDVAGYAFCDELHGPTAIINVNGRNLNEWVRRFTLAHELCHILFDRRELQSVAAFDRYNDFYAYADEKHPSESRANAFAIHLLAPPQDVIDRWQPDRDVRRLMMAFGVSFQAIRHHLDNYRLLPMNERPDVTDTSPTDEWRNAEAAELWYPAFDDIPLERRHTIARLAFRLWRSGRITTSKLREALNAGIDHQRLKELAELYGESLAA
jgi:Zn-dependent peptidase ImmA (M78 family)/transcriptional regulator with XRE-family HTH domain